MIKSVHNIFATVLLLLALRVSAGPVTLYGLSGSSGPTSILAAESISISALGVGTDGWTTYVEEAVFTSEVMVAPSTTITLISTPTTATLTFEENASGYRESVPLTEVGATLYESCGFGGNGQGTCVLHQLIQSTQEAAFGTITGSVVPFYTLGSSTSAGRPTRICEGRTGSLVLTMALVIGALFYAV
ncbi:hypothetical protein DFH08DRAFT_897985 [Mycena albidolilacea]|uniref:Uncharacterized protein n=1 Tax=Mycena albidolilacea TaxID=1033008 RepID=A0AAD7EC66_9AGAR|nr:hypothetical protein DFH08DRAFT_897985 [Mycena albidolilacea]